GEVVGRWGGGLPPMARCLLRETDDRLVERKRTRGALRRCDRRDGERRALLLGDIEGFRARRVTHHLERVDLVRHAVRGEGRRAVHHVEVQMRGDGVARVADEPEYLTAPDAIALAHAQATGL